MVRTTDSRQSPAPASRVSRTCSSKLSSLLVTEAMPPWAQLVFESARFFLVRMATRPALATFKA